jgi:hypothetical protein
MCYPLPLCLLSGDVDCSRRSSCRRVASWRSDQRVLSRALADAFCSTQGLAPLRKKLDRLYVYRIRSDYEARRLSQEEAQEALDTTEEVLRLVAQHTGLRFP